VGGEPKERKRGQREQFSKPNKVGMVTGGGCEKKNSKKGTRIIEIPDFHMSRDRRIKERSRRNTELTGVGNALGRKFQRKERREPGTQPKCTKKGGGERSKK